MAYFEELNARFPLQRHEASGEGPVALAKPDMVIYPGTSSRRVAFFNRAFPGTELVQLPIGNEPEGEDIGEVTRFKLNEAALQYVHSDQCVAIVAADTNNVTPSLNTFGEPVMISRVKPRTEQEVFETFRQMIAVSERTAQKPFYVGDSASALLHLNGRAHLVEDRMQSLIELSDRFRELGDVSGFQQYRRAFDDFYSQPPYSTSNMEVRMGDLAGGISLPVLVKMGYVASVDGVSREDARFRQQLLSAIHNVAVGISPRILKPVQIPEQEVLEGWNWLNGVVDSCLSS